MKDDNKDGHETINDLEAFPLGKVTNVSDVVKLFYRLERGENVSISNPVTVAATYKNHIVIDDQNVKNVIPRKWIHIVVRTRDGKESKLNTDNGEVLKG